MTHIQRMVIGMAVWMAVAACALWIPTAQAEQTRFNYRLKWLFNTSVAGDVFAMENGFFADAGLDVQVREGSPEKDAIKELELGYAHFGVASADQVIRALEKGADVVVLAQVFQINPMQWIYRYPQVQITHPADLKQYHLGVTFGGNDETIMQTLLATADLTLRDVKVTGVRFDFTPFLKNQVDLWPVYRNSQGVILADRLAKEGETVRFLNPADFGVDFVANSIVTSGAMATDYPDLVARFLSALLAAWEAAMDPANQASVLAAVKKYDTGTQGQVQAAQLDVTRTLVKPDPDIPVGRIQTAAWAQTEAIMLDQGLIRTPVHVTSRLRNPVLVQ
ncbi:ABC transporter substrate-binding protein [Desulfotignum balticum]|uniref:ABC transporter substrate-binding protein n=1 Tax=Desulfotignum balticum TaxID=115781 RepID=UPI0003F697DC|nr:ABC transporter substrate-binding protein [Desulfotignum balticum]